MKSFPFRFKIKSTKTKKKIEDIIYNFHAFRRNNPPIYNNLLKQTFHITVMLHTQHNIGLRHNMILSAMQKAMETNRIVTNTRQRI